MIKTYCPVYKQIHFCGIHNHSTCKEQVEIWKDVDTSSMQTIKSTNMKRGENKWTHVLGYNLVVKTTRAYAVSTNLQQFQISPVIG